MALLATVLALHALYLIGDRTWWGEWVSIWPPIGWLVLFVLTIGGVNASTLQNL